MCDNFETVRDKTSVSFFSIDH